MSQEHRIISSISPSGAILQIICKSMLMTKCLNEVDHINLKAIKKRFLCHHDDCHRALGFAPVHPTVCLFFFRPFVTPYGIEIA